MSKGLVIPDNIMARAAGSTAALSQISSSMSGANLATEEPSEFWRSLTNAPKNSRIYGMYGSGTVPMFFDTIAIVGHNLYRGDQYRIYTEIIGTPSVNGYDRLLPTATVASLTDNTAGLFSDVLGGESEPFTDEAGPTDDELPWSLGVEFPNPTSAPLVGADLQAFWVFVYRNGDTGYQYPSASCDLYQDEVFIATLGARYIRDNGAEGQWLFFAWNASLLNDPSGAKVQCKVTVSPVLTQFAYIRSIFWAEDFELRNNDSGWLTYDPFVSSLVSYKPEIDALQQSILYKYAGSVSSELLQVDFRSCRSPLDYEIENETLPTQHRFVQAGSLVIGNRWSPGTDRGHGPYVGVIDLSSKGTTDGGQVFGTRRMSLRTLSWPLGILSKEESQTLLDLIWRNGTLKKYFVHLNSGDSVEGTHCGFLATLKNAEHVISTTPATQNNRSITLEFVEAL